MSSDTSALPYRPGVGVILLNAEGNIFIAQRLDMRSEAWQMPQGGMDEGETPLTAAQRELEEETSITPNCTELLAESKDWFYYNLPPELIGKLWGGQFRGQKQKWFVMRFTGLDADINLETAHPEFSTWRWESPDRVPELIVPFKRELYRQVMTEFQPLLH